MSDKQPYDNVEFDWVKLVADLNPDQETFIEKCKRKFNENPFVPIGAFGAIGALSYGLFSMYKGDVQRSQYAMRARIGCQGFAVAALIVGFIYGPPSPATRDNR
ncbi:HIG1 domain family member 2A, mitochondrial-like [Sitodiplosis mosellana]|uniref:HIG1 domain family member 2A, mitochondrial-like n=1 Tax=Sitodiplosis mosellana TaxID=263140 RepID=UPI0024442D80|nr:HIG1 domain family member 2A, mitochondrial-like [Sitodiplosis mosellana]